MYKKILVPIDGSATAQLGLAAALRLAQPLRAVVRIVHVIDEFVGDTSLGETMYYNWIDGLRERGQQMLDAAAMLASSEGVETQTLLLETVGRRAAEVIVEQATQWPADLIVMGTHGRRGLARVLMGSDAESVVRTTPVPVLLVPERGAAG